MLKKGGLYRRTYLHNKRPPRTPRTNFTHLSGGLFLSGFFPTKSVSPETLDRCQFPKKCSRRDYAMCLQTQHPVTSFSWETLRLHDSPSTFLYLSSLARRLRFFGASSEPPKNTLSSKQEVTDSSSSLFSIREIYSSNGNIHHLRTTQGPLISPRYISFKV